VTVASDIAVSVSPQAMPVELGAARAFAAIVSSAGNPDRAVNWIVSGNGCAGTACGSVIQWELTRRRKFSQRRLAFS
jgi:hypothetical protein